MVSFRLKAAVGLWAVLHMKVEYTVRAGDVFLFARRYVGRRCHSLFCKLFFIQKALRTSLSFPFVDKACSINKFITTYYKNVYCFRF
jgi:hypothetical protein